MCPRLPNSAHQRSEPREPERSEESEFLANNFSSAWMLFFGPNSAPLGTNSARRILNESRGFQIPPSPPASPRFPPSLQKMENTAHVREVCSTKGHRRISDAARSASLILDSLCREPSRCPLGVRHGPFASESDQIKRS